MKRLINTEEKKELSLQILKSVALFCEQNNICYYLACGTLLGAIRHKGYIPWDDDIDIMMPRPDYVRFIEEYIDERYKVCKPCEGRFYYAKVYDSKTLKYEEGIDYKKYKPLGVDIDIFPLDGIDNDKCIISRIKNKSNILEVLLRLSNQPVFYRKNPIKAINRLIPRIIGSKNIVKLIEKNAQTYKYEDSEYVIRMRNTPNGFTGALKKEIYNPPVKKEFENIFFYVPRDYDKWLTSFYGDYMELPPIDKRRTHNNECFMLEE